MTDPSADGIDHSEVFVGGTGEGVSTASEYCLIVGKTSLCGTLYRRLGHPNGADFATTWDYQVSSPEDAPARAELCKDCRSEGGWGAVPITDIGRSNSGGER